MDRLKTLMEMAALINSTLDEHEIRRRAIEAAIRLMDAEAGSLLLVDRERGDLYFEIAIGEKGEELKRIRLRMGEGISGWVAQTGKPVIVHDVRNDPRFFKSADELTQFTTRDMIAAPLVHNGRVLGVLQALNKQHGRFTEGDLELFASLADQVAPAVENAYLHGQLRETFYGTILALAEALEQRDAYTGGHTRRVREYSAAIGGQLGLEANRMEDLKLAAILHDIGKIGVRDSILMKEAPLTREETASMNNHTLLGAEILGHMKSLADAISGVLSHHEKYDGSGYPHGLKGDAISLYARIIAVADTFDAMTSDRPYRKALSREAALAELKRCSGTQFDPGVVEAFRAALKKGEAGGAAPRACGESEDCP